MAKTKKSKTRKSGEQLPLIEVQPENAKAIVSEVRVYKKLQIARQAALVKEVEQKQKVLDLVYKANLQPLEGGKIKFKSGNVTVSVTPRDALIKIEEKTESE